MKRRKPSAKRVVVRFLVTPAEKRALQERAEALGVSVADLVRLTCHGKELPPAREEALS